MLRKCEIAWIFCTSVTFILKVFDILFSCFSLKAPSCQGVKIVYPIWKCIYRSLSKEEFLRGLTSNGHVFCDLIICSLNSGFCHEQHKGQSKINSCYVWKTGSILSQHCRSIETTF